MYHKNIVKANIHSMQWRDWEVTAQDREKWRSRIKKAKACLGLK
jgi:hypothetical protein